MVQEHFIVQQVMLAKENADAADLFIRDYLPFIRSIVNQMEYRQPQEDAISVAMLGFYQAIRSYSRLRGAFLTYAEIVIRRKLIDYYRQERWHESRISLDEPLFEDTETTVLDHLPDPNDEYMSVAYREAARQEMDELSRQLARFDLRLTDVSDNCPRQKRTFLACRKALEYAKREETGIIAKTLKTGRIPIVRIAQQVGVSAKTLERHRKYLLALMLIYSNGYELIRGHLSQVLVTRREEGEG